MKSPGLLLLTMALVAATAAAAQDRRLPRQAEQESPPTPTQQRAATGDVAGGKVIPKSILEILADPHIDPNVAYILWQTSRKPMEDWTMKQLAFVTQAAPTLVEAGVPVEKVQLLYAFWGLDPNDVFNPRLGPQWQAQSTAYNPRSANNVGAISSADCQVDVSLMTVATYRACAAGYGQ
ncbi:hypothetical protein [Enhydrobacter sp.]|jgi:hypothetical protein|uniref:hypothetical protein n=1 Tax=Enhydrobacter sp. TaxID=1894999 RepID=UPI00263240DE|nr:hypothetical protein [Enhydrobacter sp.]WIM09347.1 MAG: hypothetical protein OJF58_000298 [Enhydrobacter sp.]